jgi:hypothetical protein
VLRGGLKVRSTSSRAQAHLDDEYARVFHGPKVVSADSDANSPVGTYTSRVAARSPESPSTGPSAR